VIIVLGIVNSKSSLFNNFVGDSNITQTDEEDSTTIGRIIAMFVLTCSGLLQFISTTLFVTVLKNRPPKTNNFELTQTNSTNFKQYQLMYIFTYISIIVLAIVIITPLSNSSNKKEVGFYYVILIISTIIVASICATCFSSCFAIYKNVIIDGNQLTLEDVPQTTYAPPNTVKPKKKTELPLQPKPNKIITTKPPTTTTPADVLFCN
jgi:magnesium-transporting ATPase (P-type)